MNAHDAWVIRRLLIGWPIEDRLRHVSIPFRAVAGQLSGLPTEGRCNAWDGFLAGRDDRNDLTLILTAVDTSGPCPDPTVHGEASVDDWPPLRLGEPPSVDPFPIDVLPPPAARLVIEGTEAIGCPPDFLALPVLAVAGGTIGRSVSLFLKHNYFANATIFACCVGPPSDGKTPALKAVAGAVRRIDEILEAEHAQAMDRWQEAGS